ncbi:MAG: GspMb/PilO family protein [Pyrinomonadaceae bacterium]
MTPSNVDNETEISIKTTGKPGDKKVLTSSRTRISRKVKTGMFDIPEIVAVTVAGLALLSVLFAYFFTLLPARQEFKARETERSQKQTELLDLQAKAQLAGTNAAGTVDLMSSVDRFEANFLPFPANGNGALYQRLNQLIRSNGLRNTAGPEYSSLETIDAGRAAKSNNQQGRGNKQQGIFPGTYVTVTVEGSYASLRHFISDIENTRQFLVINTVEIESNESGESSTSTGAVPETIPDNPAETQNDFPNAQVQPNTVNPRLKNNPKTMAMPPSTTTALNQAKRGAVSLRLEMAAYFRRPVTVQN